MAKKRTFQFPSNDNVHKIKCTSWEPEQGQAKGILQIAHGMAEFMDRYDEFAAFMCDHGWLVVGNDHLGHGASVNDENEWGYFGEGVGFEIIVKDMHKLKWHMSKKYPDVPYILLGHSMGSFLTRMYLSQYGNDLDGAIIMGTADQPVPVVKFGQLLTSVLARFKGWKYRSQLVNSVAFGSYNKKFKPAKTDYDWLTKDEAIVDIYKNEKRCTFIFTLNGYHALFAGLEYIAKKDNIEKIPKDLPVLITSGEDDPVGSFGKGVRSVHDKFKKAGIEDLELKLYPGDRHEILNETDREQVYMDILQWIENVRQRRLS